MRTLKDEIDDYYRAEPKPKPLGYYEGAIWRYPSPLVAGLVIVCVLLPLVVGWPVWHEITRPPHQIPWWFYGDKYAWRDQHRVVPKGYDNVSRYFISCEGITCTPNSWGTEQTFWTSTMNCRLKLQVIDDKVLIRTTTGKTGFFNGDEQVHLPLQGIDLKNDCQLPAGKKLLECLHPDDKGLVLEHEEKPGLTDMLRADGVLDESTR